jgi:hypothetical protein
VIGLLPGARPQAGGRLTSEAGILLQAAIDRRLGIADRLAA